MSEPNYTIPDLMDARQVAAARIKAEIEQSAVFKDSGGKLTVDELATDLPDHADLEIPDAEGLAAVHIKLHLYNDIRELRRAVEVYAEKLARIEAAA